MPWTPPPAFLSKFTLEQQLELEAIYGSLDWSAAGQFRDAVEAKYPQPEGHAQGKSE